MQKQDIKTKKMQFIENLVNPKKTDKILNLGIGWTPDMEKILENKVKEMWTADNDIRKIKNAKNILKKTKIIFLDAENKFPLKDGYFDKVVLLEVLEHLKKDFHALKNINQILKKNGELIISVPCRCFSQAISPLNYVVHYRHYTKKSISRLLNNAGFDITRMDFVGNSVYSVNLYFSLFLKYFFGINLSGREIFFRNYYAKSWKKGRKKGMSIIIKARKR